MRIQRKTIFHLLLSGLIISLSVSCYENFSQEPAEIEFADTLTVAEPVAQNLLFGIVTDSLGQFKGRIRRNQFLSEILDDYGITYADLDQIIRTSGNIFDVRNMRAGSSYTILTGHSDTTKALYMIYEQDLVNYYVLDFTDSLHLRKEERETRTDLKYASGTIESSLWNSMKDADINPELANELSEIYAWTIDFFGLQKGDRYKIIYEENFVDTVSSGIYKIYGAWFSHAGTEFYAIPLIQDSTESYYDLEGNSLRKAFLKAPLRFSRISSGFSNSRMHPILRIRRPHQGVDYAAPVGTPVHAIGDGKVIMAEYQDGSGRIVKVKHNSVYTTAYMHLSKFGPGIATGKYVRQGEVVGYVGTSGLSTGPHLDFRFYRNGSAVNPLKVEAPPVEPVHDENREKFRKISALIRDLLDTIE